MFPQPIPFLINDGENSTINSNALEILALSKRPILIIIYGKKANRKSSILNQFIVGPCNDFFCNKQGPIQIQPTKDVNIIGPFKMKDLHERLRINMSDEIDNDIFFIDTEGTDVTSEKIGLLTLLQVSIISIYVNEGIPYGASMKNILENIECSFYVKKIFPTITNYEMCQPIILVTINDIPNKFKSDSYRLKEYVQSRTERIRELVSSYPNDFHKAENLTFLTLPEYIPNDENESRQVEVEFYWKKFIKSLKNF